MFNFVAKQTVSLLNAAIPLDWLLVGNAALSNPGSQLKHADKAWIIREVGEITSGIPRFEKLLGGRSEDPVWDIIRHDQRQESVGLHVRSEVHTHQIPESK